MNVIPLSKCLDKKLLIFGFEVADLLVIFMTLAVLNLLFGKTDQKLLLVWLPPILIAAVLKFGKKGKPENYLLHLLRFQFLPGRFCAFSAPSVQKNLPPKKRGLQ